MKTAGIPRTITRNLIAAGTFQISTKSGFCFSFSVNKVVAGGTVQIWDGAQGTGTILGTLQYGAANDAVVPPREFSFGSGLSVVTSAAFDLTISFVEYDEGV